MLCFDIHLLTVVCADVFCIPDIYVIIVIIFYFFLEPALMGLCPSDFQPPMANKYCCCCCCCTVMQKMGGRRAHRDIFWFYIIHLSL